MTLETEEYIADSTDHSIPWQANGRLDNQHNSRTPRNHTFNYYYHNSPPPVHILEPDGRV